MKAEIYVDPIVFFKKAAGTVMIASRNLASTAELLHSSISRKAYNNLLAVIEQRSWRTPARWPYDSQEDLKS